MRIKKLLLVPFVFFNCDQKISKSKLNPEQTLNGIFQSNQYCRAVSYQLDFKDDKEKFLTKLRDKSKILNDFASVIRENERLFASFFESMKKEDNKDSQGLLKKYIDIFVNGIDALEQSGEDLVVVLAKICYLFSHTEFSDDLLQKTDVKDVYINMMNFVACIYSLNDLNISLPQELICENNRLGNLEYEKNFLELKGSTTLTQDLLAGDIYSKFLQDKKILAVRNINGNSILSFLKKKKSNSSKNGNIGVFDIEKRVTKDEIKQQIINLSVCAKNFVEKTDFHIGKNLLTLLKALKNKGGKIDVNSEYEGINLLSSICNICRQAAIQQQKPNFDKIYYPNIDDFITLISCLKENSIKKGEYLSDIINAFDPTDITILNNTQWEDNMIKLFDGKIFSGEYFKCLDSTLNFIKDDSLNVESFISLISFIDGEALKKEHDLQKKIFDKLNTNQSFKIKELLDNLKHKYQYIISRDKFIDLYKLYKNHCEKINKNSSSVKIDPSSLFGYEYDSNSNWKIFTLEKNDCGSDDEKKALEKQLNAKK